jgi:exodeoxyribonuclease I
LLQLSAEEIAERLYVKQSDLPEGVSRIPLKEIHFNKSPMVATVKLLDDKSAQRLGIDKSMCEAHWQQLRNSDIASKLQEVFSTQRFPPKHDPEQQLYDGFINSHDKHLMSAIRGAEPHTLSHYSSQLKDIRLQALLFRYRARHYPQTLSESEKQQWQEWTYSRLTDEVAGASIVLDEYFERLSTYTGDSEVDQQIVEDLLAYGDAILATIDML